MKPFLLLAVRADDAAADNEYESFLACAGLRERDLRRHRLEQRPLGNVDLRDWSGIFLGGGPFNASDPEGSKSPAQRRAEADLRRLFDAVIAADFPFLGACYAIGTLGSHQRAAVDRRYAEPIGVVPVTLTREGRRDPLLRGLPATFDAFVGHKEAISRLPGHAVLLASSPTCPVQAFRVGSAVYATQFHPELDAAGLCTRIEVYKHAGYFDPAQAGELKAQAHRSNVTCPPAILRRFVRRYARSTPATTQAAPRPSATVFLSTSARKSAADRSPGRVPLLYAAGLWVPAWTGEAEDQVHQHARRPRRVLDGGRRPGAVVRLGLDH